MSAKPSNGPYSVLPPIPLLPGFYLIEAKLDGKNHTVAMLPIFQLPEKVVLANAKMLADAPRMRKEIQRLKRIISKMKNP